MKRKHFLSALAAGAVIAIIIFSCNKSNSSGTSVTTPAGTSVSITIQSMEFSPNATTVKKGTIVKWINNDGYTHTVTSDDGATFNQTVPGGNSFSYTATTAGTFAYHCNIHSNMHGTLIVTN